MNTAVSNTPELGVPELREAQFDMLGTALKKGASDFKARPLYGLLFAAFYVLAGW